MEFSLEMPEGEIDLGQQEISEDARERSELVQGFTDIQENAEVEESRGEVEEESGETDSRPTIFISYSRNPNDSAVAMRVYEELSQEYEVFLDQRTVLPGEPYGPKTEEWLKKAEFIIALISATSVNTLFLHAELEDAYERYKTQGRPNVIPVRVAYSGPYSLRLRAYIGHFQAINWDNQNYAWLFEQLHAGLRHKLSPITKSIIVSTDILPISDGLRERWAKTFVQPPELSNEAVLFEEKRLLWITGDSGVRNYVARALASRAQAESLYEVTKTRRWSELNNTNMSDSVVLLRDALPAAHLDESAAIGEWHSLRALIERNNIIIATSPDDEFERLKEELRRYQFTDYQHLRIEGNSYTDEAKIEIFSRLLDHSFRAGEIDESKYALAAELSGEPEDVASTTTYVGKRNRAKALERLQHETRLRFQENIRSWSPADIERFVLCLPQVDKLSDIAKLLQRNAAIEEEIHSWFLALDDSTRCFLLTLAIFPELNTEDLWDKYKVIVDDLRRFDAGLRLLPFGISRRRAAPNVSAEGPIYLADQRVADAIRHEVARNYREYFIELIPRLKEWSVPPGRDPKTEEQKNERKSRIEETREMREAIARAVGVVGRLGLDDILEILDYWATDSNIHIRRSVAIAMEQAARSQAGVNHALSLLEKWCLDINSPDPIRRRALAAAVALGSVTSAAPDPYVALRALQCLARLARSRHQDARFYVSMAVKRVTRHAPLSVTENLLVRLAADRRPEVRQNVSGALNEAWLYDREAAATLVDQWVLSDDENRRWAALAAVMTNRRGANGARPDRYRNLLELLEEDEMASSIASVLSETINHSHHEQVVEGTFLRLTQEAKGVAWDNLAAGLADVSLGKLENKLLPLMRSESTPLLDQRVVEVRREVLKKKLSEPQLFVNTLRTWLNQEAVRLEVFRSLTLLLDDGPAGSRGQVVAALAEEYCERRMAVTKILITLEDLAPSHFAWLSPAVRIEAFKRLVNDPAKFVVKVNEDLTSGEASETAIEALESLARSEPLGSRDQLVRALALGYSHSPANVKKLLSSLKSSGSTELAHVACEVTYRLSEVALETPHTLPSFVLEMINSENESTEVLSALDYLADPGSGGQRTKLINSLVEAKRLQTAGVDDLLAHESLKQWANLTTIPVDVTRALYVNRIFSRKFVTRLFRRK